MSTPSTLALTLNYNFTSATSSQTVSLTLNATNGTNLGIDWGDGLGTVTYAFIGSQQVLSSPTPYAIGTSVTINVYCESTPNLTRFRTFGAVAFLESATFVSSITSLTDLSQAFLNAIRLTTITNSPPSSVTNMTEMLRGTTIFNGDISGWNVSNVTNMSGMLRLTPAFNQNISSWNVGNVTDMNNMFSGATIFNQNISGWDVSKVINFNNMFNSARAFNQDISGWALGSGASLNVDAMFNGAIAFNNGGVALAWGSKTNKASLMNNMFNGCTSFNSDISGWDVSNVTSMTSMFQGATAFNQDISSWDVSKVTGSNGFVSMFQGATSFNQNLSNWTFSTLPSSNINFSGMFNGATTFNNGGVALTWGDKTIRVTNMSSMFQSSNFNQDVSSWNTANVTSMTSMFQSSAFNRNLTRNGDYWNTSKVRAFSQMFRNNSVFNGDITNWIFSTDPAVNIDMSNMFNAARAFNQDISGWNVTRVTNMGSMLVTANSFNQDISSWNISNVTSLGDIFGNTAITNLNYDSILIGWANLASTTGVRPNLIMGSGRYYTIDASGARSILTSSPNNWTISDNFLTYSISQATGTFENTAPSSVTLNGTSSASQLYTYVLSNPNVGSFTSYSGTFSNVGGTNYSASPVYEPEAGYVGPVSANWYFKSTTATVGIESLSQPINLNLTCLHSSTYVLTPTGYIQISDLQKGDLILTDDNRQVEITKISKSRMIDPKGNLLYKISKDSIKPNYPPQDVLLSYGHSVLLDPEKGNLEGEWMMVKDMIGKYPGILSQSTSEPFDLYHIHLPSFFDDNLVVNGGLVVESLGDYKTIWEELEGGRRKKDPKLRY